jgi:RecB family endonuclease NucS
VTRRILRLDGAKISVSAESRFDSERDLHDAVAAHPEVLPSEDLGLGSLIALGTELDFGAGPLDLLAVDPQGRIVIVELSAGPRTPMSVRSSPKSWTTARASGAPATTR